MSNFQPLVSPKARRSNTVSTEELLEMLRTHGSIGRRERKWAFCTTKSGKRTLLSMTGPHYLYRGQTTRHVPSYPTIYRHYRHPARFLDQLFVKDAAEIVAHIAKTFMYLWELKRHPVMQWAAADGLEVDQLEIAQHYGIATPLMDLSESIETALFFATHKHICDGEFVACTEGKGVLYIVDRLRLPPAYARRFRSIGVLPFIRPIRQWAWCCELFMGECFEECPRLAILEFDHSAALANEVRTRAESQGTLFPSDLLASLGSAISALRTLPVPAVNAAMAHLGMAYPERKFGPVTALLREAGFHISRNYSQVYSEKYWAQVEPYILRSLDIWKSEIAPDIERIVVRRNRRAEAPIEYARYEGLNIEPSPIERLTPPVNILVE